MVICCLTGLQYDTEDWYITLLCRNCTLYKLIIIGCYGVIPLLLLLWGQLLKVSIYCLGVRASCLAESGRALLMWHLLQWFTFTSLQLDTQKNYAIVRNVAESDRVRAYQEVQRTIASERFMILFLRKSSPASSSMMHSGMVVLSYGKGSSSSSSSISSSSDTQK